MPIALATPITSDAGTLTASSEVLTLPASNLLVPQPFKVWRTTGLQAYITCDLGSAELVRLVWLGYTQATSSATWRVRAADTEANLTAAPLYDSGTLSHWPTSDLGTWERNHAFLWLPGATAYRWWRIDVDNVGSSDGYYQAGRLCLADPWVPRRGMDFGAQIRNIDASTLRRANRGTAYVRQRGFWREAQFVLSHLDRESVFKEALEIERLRGTHRDVLVMLDTEEPRYYMEKSLYGMLAELGPIVAQRKIIDPDSGVQVVYSKRYHFTEMEHP